MELHKLLHLAAHMHSTCFIAEFLHISKFSPDTCICIVLHKSIFIRFIQVDSDFFFTDAVL